MGAMRTVALLMCLSLAPLAAMAATPLGADQIASVLTGIAQGSDAAFGKTVAPAQSLDVQRPPADRIAAVIARMGQEIARITTEFTAAPAAQRVAKTRAAVAQFSPETAKNGTSRSFEGTGPSLSLMRQLLFVPTASAGAEPASRVMQIIGRFEHSPKTDDTYYEYANPADLKGSQVVELPGSETSWTSHAQPPMEPGRVYALKKCRHIVILGWYCNTSLYQVRDGLPADGGAKLLATFLRPLPKGADNPKFQDGKAENIVDGYTALYIVTATPDLVLVYSLGVQSKASAPSQQTRLNEGQKAEYRQLVSRIEAELGIGKLP
jgi:hypothetical protein